MRQQTPKDAMWVCPTNEQCHRVVTEYGVQAITFHKLLGIPVGDAEYTPYDLDGTTHACMDETLQLDHDDRMLMRVVRWIREHPGPELRVMGNGDALQKTAGFALDNVDRRTAPPIWTWCSAIMMLSASGLFSKRLTLGINRRLKTDADRALFDRLYDDLFVHKLPLLKAAANAGFARVWNMDAVESLGICKAVTYTNGTAQQVNLAPGSITAGSLAVCKKSKKGKLIMNHRYSIEAEDGPSVQVNGQWYPRAWFRADGSLTCHSVQGDAIRERFVLKHNQLKLNIESF